MENKLDHFLKNKLSVDDLNLETPDISLVNEAREKIKLRKKQTIEKRKFLRCDFQFLSFST
ncbi:MAG: hypothetical protein IPJ32_13940 [Sphingobacteriaceae bacterium]|nr:hypothetical protein [Sphingobacteriaceae bacterium]